MTPIVIFWLAVIPLKPGIVAFPPPSPLFASKAACEKFANSIPNSKPGDYTCVRVFLVKGEEFNYAGK